jgi:hypothetical protein
MGLNYKIASGTIKKIGIFLFILSWIFWGMLLVITFLMPIPLTRKIVLVAVFYVLRQVFLYSALYLLKKIYFIRFLRRYRFLRTTTRISREIWRGIRKIPALFRKRNSSI